jgi:hypothetical protein
LQFVDVLNSGEIFQLEHGRLRVDPVHPQWARVLRSSR